jgi:hypothetical protein
LRALLAAANGRRRTGTLQIEHVDAVIAGVAAHPEDAWCAAAGGSVAAGDNYSTPITVILAARVDGHIHVGIAAAEAHSASPGRV